MYRVSERAGREFRWAIGLATLVVFSLSGNWCSAADIDADALLRKTRGRMAAVKTLHFKMQMLVTGSPGPRVGEFWYEAPNKCRLMVTDPRTGKPSNASVFAGTEQLLIMYSRNYSRRLKVTRFDSGLQQAMLRCPALAALLENRPLLGDEKAVAEISGDKKIDGGSATVLVVRPKDATSSTQPVDLYIRKDGLCVGALTRRTSSGTVYEIEMEFHNVVVDKPLDPAVFSIEPPKEFPATESRKRPETGNTLTDRTRAKNAFVGKPLEDFSIIPVAGGEPISVLSLKGSPLIIDFWATWCGPCKRALPFLEHAAALGEGQKLKVICVSREKLETVKQFLAKTPYELEFFIDPTGKAKAIYDIKSIPTTFAVDSDGVIRGVELGFAALPNGPKNLEELVSKAGVKLNVPDEQTGLPKSKSGADVDRKRERGNLRIP